MDAGRPQRALLGRCALVFVLYSTASRNILSSDLKIRTRLVTAYAERLPSGMISFLVRGRLGDHSLVPHAKEARCRERSSDSKPI